MSRQPRKPRKPTGIAGSTRITFGGGQAPKVERLRINFPSAKGEIEYQIADGFLRDVRNHPSAQAWFGELRRNAEDDLDFDVMSADGSVWPLELTEFVPVPFHELDDDATGHRYMLLDYVDEWLATIVKKSRHYGDSRASKRILLVYTTDWRFMLMPPAADVLQQDLSTQTQAFDYIYAYRPVDANEGEVTSLFPPPPGWVPRFSRAGLANSEVTLANVPKSVTTFRSARKSRPQ